MDVVFWELEHILSGPTYHTCWQNEEIAPDRFDCRCFVWDGQTEPPAPMYQIVGKQHDVKKSYVGQPSSRRHLSQVGFEAERWMIRATPLLFGVVTDSGSLLVAVERQHHRVQVQDQTGGRCGPSQELSTQPIVQNHQLPNVLRRQPLKQPAQGCLVWKTVQSQQIQKRTVVLKQFGLVDPTHPDCHCVDQRQQQIGWYIIGIALGNPDLALQTPAQLKLLTKSLKKHQSPIVGQVCVLERKTPRSQGFWHRRESKISGFGRVPQRSLKVRFVAMD